MSRQQGQKRLKRENEEDETLHPPPAKTAKIESSSEKSKEKSPSNIIAPNILSHIMKLGEGQKKIKIKICKNLCILFPKTQVV